MPGDEQTHRRKMVYPNQQDNQACLLTEQADWFTIVNVEVVRPESAKNIICVRVRDWDIYPGLAQRVT